MNRREEQELNDWLEGRSTKIPSDEEIRAEWQLQSIIDTLLQMQEGELSLSDDFRQKLRVRIEALKQEPPEDTPPTTKKRRKPVLRPNQRSSLDWRPVIGAVTAIFMVLLGVAMLRQPPGRGLMERLQAVLAMGSSMEYGPMIGRIDRLEGLIQLGDNGNASKLKVGALIPEGVQVVCPPGDNRVRIRVYSGAILDVESGTTLRLHERKQHLRVEIAEGSLYADVQPTQKALVLATPVTEVSATDAALALSLQPGSTRVTVDEGSAAVRNLRSKEVLSLAAAESVIESERPGLNGEKMTGSKVDLPITGRYLLVPIGGPRNFLRVRVGDERLHAVDLNLATSDSAIEWWTYLDLAGYQGRTATVAINGGRDRAATEAVLKLLKLSDSRPLSTPPYSERLRPQLHFSQRRGHASRPSGLVYHDGEYHLFWQAAVGRLDPGTRPYWGHAVSSDLIRWRELAPALRSSGGRALEGRQPDAAVGSCWPGSAHVDIDNIAGWSDFDGDGGSQAAMVVAYTDPAIGGVAFAYSTDRGRSWSHYDSNPVIRHVGRDPKLIWHGVSQRWVMAIADDGSPPKQSKPGLAFYVSKNLRDWTLASRLPGTFGSPDLFELGVSGSDNERRWVLFSQDGSYLIGTFDGINFTPEDNEAHRLHWGRIEAAQTFNNSPDGRIIQIAGTRMATPSMPFKDGFSLPMRLSLRKTADGLRVYTNPIRELERLRMPGPIHVEQQHLPTDANPQDSDGLAVTEFDAPGETYDLLISVRNRDAKRLTVDFAGGAAQYDFETQELRFGVWTMYEENFTAMPLPSDDGQVSIRLLIDRAGYDLIGGEGRCYATAPRGHLNTDGSRPLGKIRLTAQGGKLTIESLSIHAMRSIWR